MQAEISFGLWIQKRRKALDLTRAELAKKIGCSVSALRKIESDERRPSKQLAELLADALDISVDERPLFVRIARGERTLERLQSSLPAPDLTLFQHPQTFSNPISLLPLIGREAELFAVRQMLSDPSCRLVTFVGPGGIGKTRLALELIQNQSNSAVFVSLASIDSSSLIVPTIANALGLPFSDEIDPKVQLLHYLQSKKMLLVLDNMEHLLDGSSLIGEILQSASGIKILCTSREMLNLGGEWIIEIKGLNLPKKEDTRDIEKYSATRLFVQCAKRLKTDFVLTDDDPAQVARICALVEGMPLAIELAAAWIQTLSCREIAQEIERDLNFLSISTRDTPERHRSIQAVFDHSWKLLSEKERQVLSSLSVFRGGFTRTAAEQVAGASLRILSSLISKSLIRKTDDERYDFHELIQQYTAAHLELHPREFAETKAKHYDFYLGLAETADSQLRGTDQQDWLSRLEQEYANLRAALEWSLAYSDEQSGKHEDLALRLASALRWFWQIRSHFYEGCEWLNKSLDRDSKEDLQSRARALEGLALLTNSFGDHGTAHILAEQSAAIYQKFGDKRGVADALMIVGQTLRWQGRVALGNSKLEEALVLYREVGDQWNVARGLYQLGGYLADFGGNINGRAMVDESSAILESLGDRFLLVSVLVSRGIFALGDGDYSRARSHFDRSLGIAREIGNPWEMADALTNIGCILRIQGDFAAAQNHFEEALKIYQERGRGIWCIDPLCALAENDIAQGKLLSARLHLQDASASTETPENKWLQTLVGYFQGLLAYYEDDLEYAATLLEKTIVLARENQYQPDLARSLVTLGRVMRARGDTSRAMTCLQEGLYLYHQLGHKLGIATGLEGLAGLASEVDAIYSTKLFGVAQAIREAIGAYLPPVDCPFYEIDRAKIHAQLSDAAFSDALSEGKIMSLDKAFEFATQNFNLHSREI